MKKRDTNVTGEGGSNVPIVRVRSGIRKLTAHECFNTPHTPQTVPVISTLQNHATNFVSPTPLDEHVSPTLPLTNPTLPISRG